MRMIRRRMAIKSERQPLEIFCLRTVFLHPV